MNKSYGTHDERSITGGSSISDDVRLNNNVRSIDKQTFHLSALKTKVNMSSYYYDEKQFLLSKNKTKFSQRTFHIAYFFLFTIGVVLLLANLRDFIHHREHQIISSDNSSEKGPNGATNHQEYFDYIVVGGGPAGIIAAVKLARRLEEEASKAPKTCTRRTEKAGKVLLLESGHESQSSVLQALETPIIEGQPPKIPNTIDESYPTLTPTNLRASSSSSLLPHSNLNAFDVPLFWNTLSANGQDHFSHHWPVSGTFLGRALGGCGVHNAMINVRALSSDFEKWNVTNWTAEEIMPYYERLESYDNAAMVVPQLWSNNDDTIRTKRRGKNGPLKVIPAGGQEVDPVAPAFVSSCLAAGIPLASLGFNDIDESKRIGAGYYEFNIRGGMRDSVAAALLGSSSIANHEGDHDSSTIPHNLVVTTGATVRKVLMVSDENSISKPRPLGVQYITSSGRLHEAYLNSETSTGNCARISRPAEVILTAGAILTPQLLANSGIREGGSITNLPGVGKNLQDHPVVPISFSITGDLMKESSTYDDFTNFETYLDAVEDLEWITSQTYSNRSEVLDASGNLGVFGTAGFSSGAFLASPWSDDGTPDIQLTTFPRILEPHFIKKILSNKDSNYSTSMLVTVALLSADGRRKVSLKDDTHNIESKYGTDFEEFYQFKLPSITGADDGEPYLSNRDVDRLAWGIEQVRRVRTFPPLSLKTGMETYPGSTISGSSLRKLIREEVMANSHWCGSTQMGSHEDAVVDERLKVRGVQNLRILDAGVFPLIPNGNTHSTTCAVAMRGVDLILEGDQ